MAPLRTLPRRRACRLAPVALLLAGACATEVPRTAEGESPQAVGGSEQVVVEDGPAEHPDTTVVVAQEGERLVLAKRPDGWTIRALLATIEAETGTSVVPAETLGPGALDRSVEFLGAIDLPRDRAVDWLQAVLAYHGLVLVPTGPPDEPRLTVIEVVQGGRYGR